MSSLPEAAPQTVRFSDESLARFYQEFKEHCCTERSVQVKAEEMYAAMFRKADHELGTPPGILQSLTLIGERLSGIETMQSRHKSFIAGVAFAASALWVFLTDIGGKLLLLLHR